MTTYAWPHVPMDEGNPWPWGVYLPGNASIGELLVWAKAGVLDPWDTPAAPVGTTTSVATTFVVTDTWIDGGGLSFVAPASSAYTFKMLFRVAGTPPQAASTVAWWQLLLHIDAHADGSYANAALDATTTTVAFTAYGPGDTTPDGLILPADAGGLYGSFGANFFDTRYGSPIVHVAYTTFTGAGGTGTSRSYWSAPDIPVPVHATQRVDPISTHTVPLLPDSLP